MYLCTTWAPPQHHLKTHEQGVQLEGFGLYYDTTALLMSPGTDWPSILPSQWEYLFSPRRMSEERAKAFVLRPIDGDVVYLRRGRHARVDPKTEAVHDTTATLKEITLHVSSTCRESAVSLSDMQLCVEAWHLHRGAVSEHAAPVGSAEQIPSTGPVSSPAAHLQPDRGRGCACLVALCISSSPAADTPAACFVAGLAQGTAD